MRRLGAALVVLMLMAAGLFALPAEPAEANVRNTALVFLTAMDASSYKPATYTEGVAGLDGMAHFRVRANPYVHGGSFPDPLTIRYRITQEGSYVSGNDSQGTAWLANVRTTTVSPTNNVADIYVPITDDNANEADGSITFEILWGPNYIIEQSRNPTTVFVKDDDTPQVSWGGNTLAVVEGSTEGQAVLRVEPRPHQDITVRLSTQEPDQGRWSATETDDYAGQTSLDVPIDVDSSACDTTNNDCNVILEINRDTTSGVQIVDDTDAEDYEHFYLKIAGDRDGYKAAGQDWLRVTIIDDESPPPAPKANGDGTYTVPMDWPLVPEDLRKTGGEFRLLLLTNDWRDATTSNIANYDAHIQASIAGSHTGGSHPAIIPYSDAFKVVGSTPTVNARDHIDAGRDTAIYWLNGPRVAKDNAGFWSNSWEHWGALDRRTAASVSHQDRGTRQNWHWTGTNADGTKHSLSSMGSSGHVVRGQYFEEGQTRTPWVGNSATRVESHSLLGISPVFRIEKRPRLEIVQADVEEPLEFGLLGRQGRQRMLVADEPAACGQAANDVSELGGVTHPSDLVTYRVRLWADPGGRAPMWIYNPKYVVYRQGSLAMGPVDSDHWNEIWKREIGFSNFYNKGVTVRPPGEDTTYAVSGGPPRNTYISTHFDSSNWDQWQTVNVNVHCADHEDHN
ncbi:MAG: hypothetical protein OXG71_08640, partial [Rhodospirillales bacterium]|nr:hypothetical protein [Rhodospirillales bacterium]